MNSAPLGKFEQLVCKQPVCFCCARGNLMENAQSPQIDQIPHRLLTLWLAANYFAAPAELGLFKLGLSSPDLPPEIATTIATESHIGQLQIFTSIKIASIRCANCPRIVYIAIWSVKLKWRRSTGFLFAQSLEAQRLITLKWRGKLWGGILRFPLPPNAHSTQWRLCQIALHFVCLQDGENLYLYYAMQIASGI